MTQACHNDDVAETERLYSLAMLKNQPDPAAPAVRAIRTRAIARGWTVHPEPGALRLIDKTGTARAYIAFDDGPGHPVIDWAAGDGALIHGRHWTPHGTLQRTLEWLEQLPQKIRPAMPNTGTLDALPHRNRQETPQ